MYVQETKTHTKQHRLAIWSLALVIALTCSILPQAFADFAPNSEATKVLGVGRIQSAVAEDAKNAVEGRFSSDIELSAADAKTLKQLSKPLTREVYPLAAPNTSTSGATGQWTTCLASAYGPSNAGSRTASGTALTNDSFGVAVDVSMGYLLGRTVEVRYNGMVVTTTIVDTGNLVASGGRGLDLQPGVWKSFGFSSENAWGVRSVEWRLV